MVSVFIVDDDPLIQVLYKEMLLYYGFEVIDVAGNGKEAIKIFKSFSKKPDIILMDHLIPIKNGIEATK